MSTALRVVITLRNNSGCILWDSPEYQSILRLLYVPTWGTLDGDNTSLSPYGVLNAMIIKHVPHGGQ